jgi:hypothetical protein
MLFPTLFLCLSWVSRSAAEAPRRRPQAKPPALRRPFRPRLEQLEDRALPSSYTAATAADLSADINAANHAGGTNTITLTAPSTSPYLVSGLVIARNDTLTIVGNGHTLDASHAGRLFSVISGAALTLENLTLQNGMTSGSGAAAEGGGIYNQGTLVLSAVIVQGCVARGSPGTNGEGLLGKNAEVKAIPGGPAAGGGLWSGGSLTLENGTVIQNNQAIGGNGGPGGQFVAGSPGGDAFGGGLYISGGTANLTRVAINNNSAIPGLSGVNFHKPAAYGGGLYVADGKVNLSGDTVDGNSAGTDIPESLRGFGGGMYLDHGTVTLCNDSVQNNSAPFGAGGGMLIASANVYIDSFTVANTINNVNGDILGSYVLRNC